MVQSPRARRSATALDANLQAAQAPKASGEIFNVGCGAQVSLITIIETLEKILERRLERRHTASRAGDVLHSLADVSKAARLMGYVPAVDFDEGIRRTVGYFAASAAGGYPSEEN